MLTALHAIAERRITQAIESGKLRPQGWRNRPLQLDDDREIPADLKMAYKILKNSGYLPPEVETRREIHQLEELIRKTDDEHQRVRQMKKLNVLMMKLETRRGRPSSLADQDLYYRRVVEKVTLLSDKPSENQA